MAYITSFALLFLVFQIITNPHFLYVKAEQKPKEGTDKPVSPTGNIKGTPIDGSEGEEQKYLQGIWL